MPGSHDLAEERDIPWEGDGPSAVEGRIAAPSSAIYYRLPDTPIGHHIKEYPSGLRQLVRFVGVEEQVVKVSLN
ncbi:hypothetical protein N6G02_23975 [Cupriavidus gilardii]|uniref:Uncharacterized protein n=1 Tax=Cupriavidus gilardii TaxID=82541 RepID=A0A6N1BBJ5_9BURK|nr:hypothetical protein [Cupriavidus gilardii]ALD93624.1 hypothetical protein CR3_4445 [Cupriavidus gilardii CR3]QQE08929.1 hypothetical protein IC580_22940 [Cupriavidus sp. ISTL7]KAB0594100.1 hypothetical protein F7Q96_23465 [Cupriavidus gilardii]MCT9016848.1 hypothetical protein [Cupriavidus gilardii]MCT9056495.1 hypothetical protein [Cupriavidus gilardii]